LTTTSPFDGPLVGPDDVEFLEQALAGARIKMTAFQVAFGVARFVQLPASRLGEAKAWIAGASTLRALPEL